MSTAGRCMALSTSSGTVVGPGIIKNARPFASVMANLGQNLGRMVLSGGKRSLPPVRRPRKGSHDVLLQHLAAGGDPVEAERRQVKCAIASTDDKLGDAAADR